MTKGENSPHNFTNHTGKVTKFIAIKQISRGQDKNEIFKTVGKTRALLEENNCSFEIFEHDPARTSEGGSLNSGLSIRFPKEPRL